MSNKVLKPKKCSLCQFSQTYANNPIKWPTGFSCGCCDSHNYYIIKRVGETKISYVIECKNCHKQYSLLAGTVFQSCKLNLYKLLLAIYLFFNENKGISAIDLFSYLDVDKQLS